MLPSRCPVVVVVVVVVAAAALLAPAHAGLPLPASMVALGTGPGDALLAETLSDPKATFTALILHWEAQASNTSCGPASVAAVLNALGVPGRAVPGHDADLRYWTQANLFASAEAAAAALPLGIGLPELAALTAAAAGPNVRVGAVLASDLTLDQFRRLVRQVVRDPNAFVVVNYDRRSLGQVGGGHHSPIGAYHFATDRVLVLDTAKAKYAPAWVKVADLFDAMSARVESGRTRGFLKIERIGGAGGTGDDSPQLWSDSLPAVHL